MASCIMEHGTFIAYFMKDYISLIPQSHKHHQYLDTYIHWYIRGVRFLHEICMDLHDQS